MKQLTIGRNNACDIIIPDTSDLVSRKQAVLTYTFWGKMVIYDTSNNGTYVNGQKLENGKGMRVTRKDKVSFARIADLDWNEVKDPYRKEKLFAGIGSALFFILALLLLLWFFLPDAEEPSIPVNTEVPVEKGETVTTVKPNTVDEQPKRKSAPKTKNKAKTKKRTTNNNSKGKSVTPNDVMNKEVNDKSPIVY